MVKIRLATREDLDEVARVYSETFNQVSDEGWTVSKAKKLFEYWLERQPDLFFVAEKEGRIVGGIACSIKPWFDGNRLQDGEIFVLPLFQRKGIGKKLFARELEVAIENYGVKTMEAITFSGDGFPYSWYREIGLKKEEGLTVITGSCQEILNNLSEK